MPGVGQPPVRVGRHDDLGRVGDPGPVRERDREGGAGLPVRLHGHAAPVALGEGRLGQRLPELLGRGADIGGVDELGLVHRSVLQGSFQAGQGVHPLLVVLADPALGDFADGRGVEVVVLLPAAADRGHEVGRFQDRQVLADRLPGHVQALGQLAQRLAVALVQAVQEAPAAGVGQRAEHVAQAGVTPRLLIGSRPAACLRIGSRLAACQAAGRTGLDARWLADPGKLGALPALRAASAAAR